MDICSDNIHESTSSPNPEELVASAVVGAMDRQSVDNVAAEATVSGFPRSASQPRQRPTTPVSEKRKIPSKASAWRITRDLDRFMSGFAAVKEDGRYLIGSDKLQSQLSEPFLGHKVLEEESLHSLRQGRILYQQSKL